jgi:hypothetical protein
MGAAQPPSLVAWGRLVARLPQACKRRRAWDAADLGAQRLEALNLLLRVDA